MKGRPYACILLSFFFFWMKTISHCHYTPLLFAWWRIPEYQVLVSTWLQCVLFPFFQESKVGLAGPFMCSLHTFYLRSSNKYFWCSFYSHPLWYSWKLSTRVNLGIFFLMFYEFLYCPCTVQCLSPGPIHLPITR